MLKKLSLATLLLTSVVYGSNTPKTGCILAQQGEVKVAWEDNNNLSGEFKNVIYNPIKVEGPNFRTILVGSKIVLNTKPSKTILEIVSIKADKRIKGQPRTGDIAMKIQNSEQLFNMKYSFANNLMEANGNVNFLDYKNISFKMNISAILCAAPKSK
ncbi:MAG: hypothetical protein ISR68_01625 [Campylobacterales bacterium]|nr:hypothetical protein [Campylobacterales bacterium]